MSCISKIEWDSIKESIKKANYTFYELIESKSPSKKLSLYLAEYSYGDLIGNKKEVFLPDKSKQLYILGSKNTPNELMNDLGYGQNSFPLGMILENYCEWFYQDEHTNEYFPYAIQGKDTIFNQQIIFNEDFTVENNTISVSSGAKSLFMLPYIGCQSQHERIKSSFSVSLPAPKSVSEHFNVFREILSGLSIQNQWTSKIIYFSKDWINEIRNNKEWLPIKYFFSENLRKRFSSDLYNSFYNDLFLTTESINRFRPTPFLVDTAKYIFSITMGQGIGFKPATNNDLLPLSYIQEAYTYHYQLPYTPTIMVPSVLEKSDDTVYYSLQQPSSKINTFKVRMNNSTYRELVALKGIVTAYTKSFISDKSKSYETDLFYACKNIELAYYHNKPSEFNQGILNSRQISQTDHRFHFSYSGSQEFSADAKFFRGCIKISR